jgi:glutamyl-tRNA reductase
VKPNPNETYESWVERVRMFEHGVALQEIAQGKDPNEVLEKMSRRIMDKLLHPVFKAIKDSVVLTDTEASRKAYEENYMKKYGPKADHIDDTLT